MRSFDNRAEADAFVEDIAQADGGPVSIEERFLGKCRGCRGLGWLGPEALFRCPGCVKDGRAPTPLTPSEAAYERVLEAAEMALAASGSSSDPRFMNAYDTLAWYLERRRTMWERL